MLKEVLQRKSLHLLRRKIHILQMIIRSRKAAQEKIFARLNFIFSNYSNHSGCSLHSSSSTENDYPRPHKLKSF